MEIQDLQEDFANFEVSSLFLKKVSNIAAKVINQSIVVKDFLNDLSQNVCETIEMENILPYYP